MRHPLALVPALAALAAAAVAADPPESLGRGGSGTYLPASPGGSEMAPGTRLGVNSSRLVLIRGLVDLDALAQGNYTDGNSEVSDHRGYGLIRAELGAKVKMDEKVAAAITVAYYDEAGRTSGGDGGTTPTPTVRSTKGGTVVDDAYVELKEFIGFEQLGITAGRQPFAWNLRQQHGAFLYDSRANDPAVTSWDGVRVGYAGFEGVDMAGYAFRQPDNASIFGLAIDWKPAGAGDQRWFLSASANLERNVVLRPTVGGAPDEITGDRLITYYVGGEADFSTIDVFGEFAMQQGDQGDGVRFAGWGASAGIDFRFQLPQQLVLGVQVDWLTGDDDPDDRTNRAFINNWEAVSDALIVEHEKYGELSRYVQGNLQALKIKGGVAFDEANTVRLNALYGLFRFERAIGGSDDFGHEVDLQLTWQYTYNATFNLFAAAFLPRNGFQAVAPGTDPSNDTIYLMGINLGVVF